MITYEKWKEQLEIVKKILLFLGFLSVIVAIGCIIKTNGRFEPIFISLIVGGVFIIIISFYIKTTEEDYLKATKKLGENDSQSKPKQNPNSTISNQNNDQEKRTKKHQERLDNLEILRATLVEYNSLNSWIPKNGKLTLIENESIIIEKLGDAELLKILKVVSFIADVSKELENLRSDIIKEIKIDYTINLLQNDFNRDPKSLEVLNEKMELQALAMQGKRKFGKYGDSRIEGAVDALINFGKDLIPSYNREIQKIQYLEGLLISMILLGTEGKKLRYFEIMESFEKMGSLDSTWQKNTSKQLQSIEDKLSNLIEGIITIQGKMDDIIEQGDSIIQEVQSLNSKMDTSLLIQALNLYQNFKANRK